MNVFNLIPLRYAPTALTVVGGLKEAIFTVPVLMLFYGFKGVDIGDFFLIQGLSWLCVFAFEIPTGYIGDVFSRKNTVILGMIGRIIGYLFWIFGYGFWWLLAGEMMFALSIALTSGTMEAYLYDLLKKRHKQHAFHKKLSKIETCSGVGLLLATFSGAFLYQFIGPTTPVWFSVGCLSIASVILLLMPDVPESRRKKDKNKSTMQDVLAIVKFSLKNTQIRWLILYPAMYGMLTLILMWGLQSVMIARDIPVYMFSTILGGNALCRIFWSSVSGKLLGRFGLDKVIRLAGVVIVIATIGACAAIYVPYVGVYACLILMMIGSGSVCLTGIVTSTLIHHRIESDERSTIISVKSMIGTAFCGVGMIALKPLFDTVGVGETFLISALLLIPILLFSVKLYRMHLQVMAESSHS